MHRENFNNNEMQLSTLLSIKTGSCPEDCAYCPQSAHHNANLKKEKLIELKELKKLLLLPKRMVLLDFVWELPGGNPQIKI